MSLSDREIDMIAGSGPGIQYPPYVAQALAREVQRLRTALAATVDELLVKDARMAELEEMVR